MSDHAPKVLSADRNNAAISPTSPIYRVAGIEVDPSCAQITRGGDPVLIRPKTYRVLLFLLERPERIVTRDELIEGVWEGVAVSDDVLIRCVAELRKVFGDDPRNPQVLKTFPKMGYGLMASVLTTPLAASPLPRPRPSWTRRWILPASIAAIVLCALIGWRVLRPKPASDDLPFFEVAWWQLNDGKVRAVADTSGNHHDGELVGPANWVAGKLGGGLRFLTMESAVRGHTSSSWPVGDLPRTVTAWIRLDRPRVDHAVIFEYGSPFRGPTRGRFALTVSDDGRISFGAAIAGGYIVSPSRWDDGDWHLITGVYGDPKPHLASIYVDGHLEIQQTLTTLPATDALSEWSMGRSLLGGPGFRGEIDDVRIYAWGMDAAKVHGLYRCAAGIRDLDNFYYLPVFYKGLEIGPRQGQSPADIRNDGMDYTGMQLAPAGGDCGLHHSYGANVGQNLRISADVLVPTDAARHITQAGPYFRSRRGMGGDGLMGGTSAGYWVALQSNGMLKVKCLNPNAVVAFSHADPAFDPSVFHHLEVVATGPAARVWLDGKAVSFDLGTALSEQVPIPPAWDAAHIGKNQGAAGMAFGAEDNRGLIGGQRARNMSFAALP